MKRLFLVLIMIKGATALAGVEIQTTKTFVSLPSPSGDAQATRDAAAEQLRQRCAVDFDAKFDESSLDLVASSHFGRVALGECTKLHQTYR